MIPVTTAKIECLVSLLIFILIYNSYRSNVINPKYSSGETVFPPDYGHGMTLSGQLHQFLHSVLFMAITPVKIQTCDSLSPCFDVRFRFVTFQGHSKPSVISHTQALRFSRGCAAGHGPALSEAGTVLRPREGKQSSARREGGGWFGWSALARRRASRSRRMPRCLRPAKIDVPRFQSFG